MSTLGWVGLGVGLLVAVGIGYTLVEWYRERNGDREP